MTPLYSKDYIHSLNVSGETPRGRGPFGSIIWCVLFAGIGDAAFMECDFNDDITLTPESAHYSLLQTLILLQCHPKDAGRLITRRKRAREDKENPKVLVVHNDNTFQATTLTTSSSRAQSRRGGKTSGMKPCIEIIPPFTQNTNVPPSDFVTT